MSSNQICTILIKKLEIFSINIYYFFSGPFQRYDIIFLLFVVSNDEQNCGFFFHFNMFFSCSLLTLGYDTKTLILRTKISQILFWELLLKKKLSNFIQNFLIIPWLKQWQITWRIKKCGVLEILKMGVDGKKGRENKRKCFDKI